MTTMPRQKPHRSKQDFRTPAPFVRAVKHRLGITDFVVDLAADGSNALAPRFLTKEVNALTFDWGIYAGRGWCWLNPPFGDITPWAAKCAANTLEGGAYSMGQPQLQVAFLVPASVGSNWHSDYVEGHADIIPLKGRVSFDGIGPYPTDLMLCLYGNRPKAFTGYCRSWDWRKELS